METPQPTEGSQPETSQHTTLNKPTLPARTTVTKSKSPGRVAAGKKLAEYNKRNKELKQSMMKQTKTTIQQPTQTASSQPSKTNETQSYTNYILLGGLAAVVVGGYLYKIYVPKHKCIQRQPESQPSEPAKEVNTPEKTPSGCDPFIME